MSWRIVLRSHKTRLALASSAVAGLLLAVLFTLAIVFARSAAIGEKKQELSAATRLVIEDLGDPGELDELALSYPNLSAAVFRNRTVQHRVGPAALSRIDGFRIEGELLTYGIARNDSTIVVGTSLRDSNQGLNQLGLILLLLWFPTTLLVGGATWISANSVFKPLGRMSMQAAQFSGSNLSERIDSQDKAEFGSLAKQLNAMLDRIQESVEREEQFAADAAHELRTPLAILRTGIETTLLSPRKSGEYVASLEGLLVEVERLTALVESLLQSAVLPEAPTTPTDLRPILLEAVKRWQKAAESKLVRIEVRSEPAAAPITTEEFQIVLDNLLDNALRYSPTEGLIAMSLSREGEWVCLTVTDDGPGVPAELGARVFDRFFRAEDSRTRQTGGAGIGLAVSKRIVKGRGGAISLEGRSTFRVVLPATSQ